MTKLALPHRSISRILHLGRDIAFVSFGKYGQYLVTLVTVPLIARVLGPSGLGLLAVGMSAYFFGSVLVDFGLTTALASRAAVLTDLRSLRANYALLRLMIVASMIVAAALTVTLVDLPAARIIAIGACAGGLSSVGEDWIFVARMAYGRFALFQAAGRAFYLLCIIFGFCVLPIPETVLFSLGASSALSAGMGWRWARREGFDRPTRHGVLELVKSARAPFASRLVSTGYSQGAALIYSGVVPTAVLGVYSAGDKIIRAGQGLFEGVATALLPRLSRQAANDSKFWKNTTSGLVVVFALAATCSIFLWITAPAIIPFVYGPRFELTIPVFRILAFIIPATAVTSMATSAVLFAWGDQRGVLYASIMGLIVTLFAVGAVSLFPVSTSLAWGSVGSEWFVMFFVLLRMRFLKKQGPLTK